LGDWNTRRAAIRRIVRGAAKDLLIQVGAIVSGQARRVCHETGASARAIRFADTGD
jgi:hypothetical protein